MQAAEFSEYALPALIALAVADGGLVTSGDLAQAQAIPGRVLEGVMTDLRRARLVSSRRGPDGGFRLARPAAAISLAEVIRAVSGPQQGRPSG